MSEMARQAQTVPGAVSAALLIAGLVWFTAATNIDERTADNIYFEPSAADCGSAAETGDRGLMPGWLRP